MQGELSTSQDKPTSRQMRRHEYKKLCSGCKVSGLFYTGDIYSSDQDAVTFRPLLEQENHKFNNTNAVVLQIPKNFAVVFFLFVRVFL
jgi:hypothetical protein